MSKVAKSISGSGTTFYNFLHILYVTIKPEGVIEMVKTVIKSASRALRVPGADLKNKIKRLLLLINRSLEKTDKLLILHTVTAFGVSAAKIFGTMTPFGTAFFASVCNQKNLMPVLIAVAAGTLAAHRGAFGMCYILTVAVIAVINALQNKKIPSAVKAYITGAVLFAFKTIAAAEGGFLAYDMIMNFGEAFICMIMVFVFDKAAPVIFSGRKRSFLSFEETVSTVCTLAIMLLAVNNLPAVGSISAGRVLSIAVIMLMSDMGFGTAGTISGIIIGAVNSAGTYNSGAIIGAYGFSALVASVTSRYGKTGTALGFIVANAAITLFINGSSEVLISIYEILLASVLFFAGYKAAAPFFSHLLKISNTAPCADSCRQHSDYSDRLKKTAESLEVLSKNFTDESDGEEKTKNLVSLINKTAEKACSDCSLRYCCWNKKSSETKDALFSLLERAGKTGRVYLKDVNEEVKRRCIRTEKLVSSFNDAYESYRTARLWQKRIADCKELSATQMHNISKILYEMAEEEHFRTDAQTVVEIRSALDCAGVIAEGVNAYIKPNGSFVTELKIPADKYNDDMRYVIAPCISDAVGVRMRFNDISRDGRYVYISYSMRERYSHVTGGASIKKNGEKVCGDSFTALNLPEGVFVAAISDGMGSGEAAEAQSRKTISLLKSFLRCGFDTAHSVSLINSSLLLSGGSDTFSTIDLCSVNMHTGTAEFLKTGAAGTYIKTGDTVERLSSGTLPAGIIKEITPKRFTRKIDEESLVIMVSDGVENASADDRWLEKKLKTVSTVNPHVMADKILDMALYHSGGTAKDDMTVVATRIWKENNV